MEQPRASAPVPAPPAPRRRGSRINQAGLGSQLVRLYNATKEEVDELMYGQAKGLQQKLEKAVFTRLPGGWRTVDLHVAHFREVVDRWLAGKLTREDHWAIAVFVLNHRGPDSYEGRTFTRIHPGFIRRFLLRQFKKNPLEPLTAAYWELHLFITAEGEGRRLFPPRRCEWCGRLYLPIRQTLQKTCSPKCGKEMRYRLWLERQDPSRAKKQVLESARASEPTYPGRR